MNRNRYIEFVLQVGLSTARTIAEHHGISLTTRELWEAYIPTWQRLHRR